MRGDGNCQFRARADRARRPERRRDPRGGGSSAPARPRGVQRVRARGFRRIRARDVRDHLGRPHHAPSRGGRAGVAMCVISSYKDNFVIEIQPTAKPNRRHASGSRSGRGALQQHLPHKRADVTCVGYIRTRELLWGHHARRLDFLHQLRDELEHHRRRLFEQDVPHLHQSETREWPALRASLRDLHLRQGRLGVRGLLVPPPRRPPARRRCPPLCAGTWAAPLGDHGPLRTRGARPSRFRARDVGRDGDSLTYGASPGALGSNFSAAEPRAAGKGHLRHARRVSLRLSRQKPIFGFHHALHEPAVHAFGLFRLEPVLGQEILGAHLEEQVHDEFRAVHAARGHRHEAWRAVIFQLHVARAPDSAGRPVTFPAVAAASRASTASSFGSSTDTAPLPTDAEVGAAEGAWGERGGRATGQRGGETRRDIDRRSIGRGWRNSLANGTNARTLAIAERLRLWPPTLGAGAGARSADIFAAAMARRGCGDERVRLRSHLKSQARVDPLRCCKI